MWPKVIADIKRLAKRKNKPGKTDQEIADTVGGCASNISKLNTNKGTEPVWSKGQKLLRLRDRLRKAKP